MAAVGLAFAWLLAAAAAAETDAPGAADANLAALTEVRVTASQTTPDAAVCTVDLRDMLPFVESQLQAGGLRPTKAPEALVTFSLMTKHEPTSGFCATAVMLGAYRLAEFFDAGAGWLKSGYVVLWQRGAQTLSSPNDHRLAIERMLARLTESLLESWRQQRDLAAKGQ